MTTYTECAMKQEFPEFLELQIPGNSYGRDGDITCALPAQSYPTRFYQRTHPTHIYMSHVIQILEEPSRVHYAI